MLMRTGMGCDVVLLVDAETGTPISNGGFRVDAGSVESQVLKALRQCGYRVAVTPYDADKRQTVKTLRALSPRVIFNLTEWIDGDRTRDHEITS